MALIDLLKPDVIKVPLQSDTKESVIRELLQVLQDAGTIGDTCEAFQALMEREGRGSTGLEHGIAVLHAKSASVSALVMAMGISYTGTDFDAIDGKPSRLFFLMLAAPDRTGPHIEALSDIARLTRSRALCSLLLHSRSPQEVMDLITEEA